MKSHFTTREVAKILALPEWRIRSCIRAGFLSPSRGPRRHIAFSFQDLLLLKTTKGLLNARVPLRRIRRILRSLKQQLPEQEVWKVTIYADGKRVVVWDGGKRWQPDSGQFLFNFAAREIASRINLPLGRKAAASARDAQHWFNVGWELESDSPEEARRAYLQAVSLDPCLIEAHLNLGRLYHEASEFDSAETQYRSAIAQAPQDALAHFNLGVLLEDRGRIEEAVAAYRQALSHDSNLADAHYNLGLIFEAQGRRAEAFRHLRAAQKLYLPK
ncbi:MAG TPA: tetratricopeptide repeat protein [Candidatus Binatia bacterium]|jgi:tetratricopeptide (TPR) repeat protein